MNSDPRHIVEAAGGIPYRWNSAASPLTTIQTDMAQPTSTHASEARAIPDVRSEEIQSQGTTSADNDNKQRSDTKKHRHNHKKSALTPRQYADYDPFKGLEVCLVHRPKYDDWSWPKGKLEANESAHHAAVREIEEETGVPVCLGPLLGEEEYSLDQEGQKSKHGKASGNRSGLTKHVTYWMATPIDAAESKRRATAIGPIHRAKPTEVDEVAWMPVSKARKKLTRALDRNILDGFVSRVKEGALTARTFIIVRHGKAESRKHWEGTDADRPIMPRGAASSFALIRELGCYAPTRLVSSPWLRCRQTIEPYAWHTDLPVIDAEEFTEDAFAADAGSTWKRVKQEIDSMLTAACANGTEASANLDASEQGRTLVCMHRPVIGGIFEHLRQLCTSSTLAKQLIAKTPYMPTGNAIALFIVPGTNGPHIIDIQRMAPLVY